MCVTESGTATHTGTTNTGSSIIDNNNRSASTDVGGVSTALRRSGSPGAVITSNETSEKKPSRLISSLSSLAKSTSFRMYRERRAREEGARDASADSSRASSLLRLSNESSVVATVDSNPGSPGKQLNVPSLAIPENGEQLSPGKDVIELSALTEKDTLLLVRAAKIPRGLLKRSYFLRCLLLLMMFTSSSTSVLSTSTTLNPSVMSAKYWLFLLSLFGKIVFIRKLIYLSVFILLFAIAATSTHGEMLIDFVSQFLSVLKM